MIESDPEDFIFEDWDEEESEESGPIAPPWRKPLLVIVAAITAVALAIVPIMGFFRTPPVADNGLEICSFDYCVVQDAVTAAGYDEVMARLSRTYLPEDEAQSLVRRLTDFLDEPSVDLIVVERLDGRLGGVYDPADRAIYVESPVKVWTLIHEVAHVTSTGHGDAFQAEIIELASLFEEPA